MRVSWITSARTGVVMLAVLVSLGAGVSSNSFYDPPLDLTIYAVGDLIKWESVSHLGSPLNNTIGRRIMYRSANQTGDPIAITGLVFAPNRTPPVGGWPVVSFAHGTTGVGDACAPSKYRDLYWPEYAWLVGRLVRDGFVVVATDYEGLGTPGLHPYLDLASEARSVIDAVPAARQLVPQAGLQWAVVGHSQGGHAALGTGEHAVARQRPPLSFVGTVALAPGSHLADLVELLDGPAVGWDLLAYGAASIKASDPSFDYAELLTGALLDEMTRAEVVCEVELFKYFSHTYGSISGLDPLWRHSVAVQSWLERNEPGQTPSSAPVLIIQGANDPVVPAWATSELTSTLCANGDEVTYLLVPGANHDAVLYNQYNALVRWLSARFEGAPPISIC